MLEEKVKSRRGKEPKGDARYHNTWLLLRNAHCNKILVSAGQRVAKGKVIALVGQTGRVTGPHLHLNVEIDGVLQNPREYIN